MVNAANFPGPALWQGLMFLLLPVWFFFLYWRGGKYLWRCTLAYALIGVALFFIIVRATH